MDFKKNALDVGHHGGFEDLRSTCNVYQSGRLMQ